MLTQDKPWHKPATASRNSSVVVSSPFGRRTRLTEPSKSWMRCSTTSTPGCIVLKRLTAKRPTDDQTLQGTLPVHLPLGFLKILDTSSHWFICKLSHSCKGDLSLSSDERVNTPSHLLLLFTFGCSINNRTANQDLHNFRVSVSRSKMQSYSSAIEWRRGTVMTYQLIHYRSSQQVRLASPPSGPSRHSPARTSMHSAVVSKSHRLAHWPQSPLHRAA